MIKKLLVLLVLLTSSTLFAQDAEGCKDHPLLTRMPDYYISECSQNFNQLDFYNELGQEIKLEGTLTYSWYIFNTESGKTEPSYLQIIKNIANAIIKIGGKKIYEEKGLGCYNIKKNGKEYNIKVACTNNSDYLLYVLEMEDMKQDIVASDILEALNTTGRISLYINFETAKSEIKPESQKIITQIYDMLKENPTIKISIEGHTDNTGNNASNQTLSENRSKAVVNALLAKGIDKSRLVSKGWGQTKPVAENNTDAGKAQNRRVEIVKL